MTQKINLTTSPVSIATNVQWLLATSNRTGMFYVATGAVAPAKDVGHEVSEIALGPTDQVWLWAKQPMSIIVSNG